MYKNKTKTLALTKIYTEVASHCCIGQAFILQTIIWSVYRNDEFRVIVAATDAGYSDAISTAASATFPDTVSMTPVDTRVVSFRDSSTVGFNAGFMQLRILEAIFFFGGGDKIAKQTTTN